MNNIVMTNTDLKRITSKKIGAATSAEYLRVAARSAALSIDDIALMKKNTRRVVVASLKRCYAAELLSLDGSIDDSVQRGKLIALCERFPDRDFVASPSAVLAARFASLAAGSAPTLSRVCQRSKRATLRLLPDDWREQVVGRVLSVESRYAPAVAALACFGLRPEELALGVELRAENGKLTAVVANVKQREKITSRSITIDDSSSRSAVYLSRVCQAFGGTKSLKIDSKNALRNVIRRSGRFVFLRVKDAVSPYCFRHQFAADSKRAGNEPVETAKALGHASDKMQSRYGSANQGNSPLLIRVHTTLEPALKKEREFSRMIERTGKNRTNTRSR